MKPIIVKGSDRVFDIYLVSEKTGRPYDLTGYTAIRVKLLKDDNTVLTRDSGIGNGVEVVGSPQVGHLRVTLTDVETGTLKTNENAGVIVEIDKGDDTLIVQMDRSLRVVEPIF